METTKNGLRIASKHATTKLECAALAWLNDSADYDNGAAGRYADLMQGGCASGIVGHLIYTRDCVTFYRRHRKDIAALLHQTMEDVSTSMAELFGDKWDASDPLALDDPNQNLLAWFGFEEAARNIAMRAGLED